MTTPVVEPLLLDLAGPNLSEMIDATALLVGKYDAHVSFLVDVDAAAEVELILRFEHRGVRAVVTHPTGHTIDAAKSLGLAVPHSILSCRKEG